MSPPTLDDLLALVQERGSQDDFPSRDELFGLLEPFRALPDQESLQLALAAAVRKGERLRARVAAQALAYLGGDAAGSLLIAIVTDEALPLERRAAAAWAISNLLPGLSVKLSGAEQRTLAGVPMLEMLGNPEAEGAFGLQAFAESYQGLPAESRLDFVKMLAEFARAHGRGVAAVCMHILNAEEDPQRRLALMEIAAADRTQEAADLLATFAKATDRAGDAKEARRHLHLLRAKGIRGEVRADFDQARAFVTGVDGDACFSINFVVPRAPTFEVINILLHLTSGLRDGFLLPNVPRREVDALIEKIRVGTDNIAAFVPLPLAARIADEALAKPRGLESEEMAAVMAAAAPVLERARRQPLDEPALPAKAALTPLEAKVLLEGEGFDYWFFEAGENAIRPSLAALRKPTRAKRPQAFEKLAARRLEAEAMRVRDRLVADGEPDRLARMLHHQARLLACMNQQERAAVCRRAAVEVTQPSSVFLISMAVRSLVFGLEAPEPGESDDRWLEGRASLRARMKEGGRPQRKQDVLALDLAAAAFTALNTINREQPSSARSSLNAIEGAALALGIAFADGLLDPSARSGGLLRRFRTLLAEHDVLPQERRRDAASDLLDALAAFADQLCGDQCPHECIVDPLADGRVLFHAEGHPWDVPASSLRRSAPPARDGSGGDA